MSNFYLWCQNLGKRSACSYYRIEVPMRQLATLDYAQHYMATSTTRESLVAMTHADVAHFYAIGGEKYLHQVETLRRMKSGTRNGTEIYPPTLIYDIDDNNDFVHPFNTTYPHMGVRGYPDARLLKPGEGMEIFDAHGSKLFEIVDKETHYNGITFDIERNLHQMAVRHRIIRSAHGATVSSPALAKYFKDVIGQPNVYVFPNTVVPEDYENIRAVRTDDSVRILWQGGMSHWVDWYPLRDALKTICQKHPNIKFVIFGEWFKWIHEVIPDSMVEHHPWVEYDAYRLKRGLLNVDINLCPLAKDVFNAGKSAIKWYEASIWEKPEATLASNFGPYQEIIDGETGLLYDTPEEFVQKLSLLIEDATLRTRLASSARRWVMENRTPQATIPGLFDFYTETRAQHRRELGRPLLATPTLDEIKKVGKTLLR